MTTAKSLSQWLRELGLDAGELAERANLDRKVVEAIADGRYTTSPAQRKRLSQALGVEEAEIRWGGAREVDHMYGHGPQFGRSP